MYVCYGSFEHIGFVWLVYYELLHKVFPNLGENCRIEIPFAGVRTGNVKFGRNVIIMPGCLMMSAGGITIDDDV